ncbi:MAG: right-handed parallel beta-helix repeat-containing protein, partial [Deltaproteobacteria bacterium]|nr:right-handed parallel beta-helix repeat-containing protein [Deltaproteobacteria bacterium]
REPMKLIGPLALLSLLLAGGCCWNADSCTEVWGDGGVDAPVEVGPSADGSGDGQGSDGLGDGGGDAREDAMADAMPECTSSLMCAPTQPICDNGGMCRACGADKECSDRADGKAVCENGVCVQCKTNAQCGEATPVCGAGNKCRVCWQDAECTTGPGLCLESEGRCAKDSEVQYVESKMSCAATVGTANGGSADKPFCAPQLAVDVAISRGKPIIILRDNDVLEPVRVALGANDKIYLVGKGKKEPSTTIKGGASAPGIQVNSGIVYVRGVVVKGGFIEGVRATGTTAELNMNRCIVQDNRGGGILLQDGAAFEITNTMITGNGSEDVVWGGINIISGAAQSRKAILRHVTIAGNADLQGLACDSPIMASGLLSLKGAARSILTKCAADNCCSNPPLTNAYKMQSSVPECLNKHPVDPARDLIDVFGQVRIDSGDCGADELDGN